MLPVAILAGGLATRLRPLTETTAKSLVLVNGEPFVAHQMRLLRSQGVDRVVLCVGHFGDSIREFVGDGRRFGLTVTYSWDGAEPLGTAGAIRQALPLLPDAFFVLYGDSYLTCNFQEVEDRFHASGKRGLMTVYRNEGAWDTSNVSYRNGSILLYDKKGSDPEMSHIDYGLGIFRKDVFSGLPAGPQDLAEIHQKLLVTSELDALEVQERFYEIGSFAGITALSEMLGWHPVP